MSSFLSVATDKNICRKDFEQFASWEYYDVSNLLKVEEELFLPVRNSVKFFEFNGEKLVKEYQKNNFEKLNLQDENAKNLFCKLMNEIEERMLSTSTNINITNSENSVDKFNAKLDDEEDNNFCKLEKKNNRKVEKISLIKESNMLDKYSKKKFIRRKICIEKEKNDALCSEVREKIENKSINSNKGRKRKIEDSKFLEIEAEQLSEIKESVIEEKKEKTSKFDKKKKNFVIKELNEKIINLENHDNNTTSKSVNDATAECPIKTSEAKESLMEKIIVDKDEQDSEAIMLKVKSLEKQKKLNAVNKSEERNEKCLNEAEIKGKKEESKGKEKESKGKEEESKGKEEESKEKEEESKGKEEIENNTILKKKLFTFLTKTKRTNLLLSKLSKHIEVKEDELNQEKIKEITDNAEQTENTKDAKDETKGKKEKKTMLKNEDKLRNTKNAILMDIGVEKKNVSMPIGSAEEEINVLQKGKIKMKSKIEDKKKIGDKMKEEDNIKEGEAKKEKDKTGLMEVSLEQKGKIEVALDEKETKCEGEKKKVQRNERKTESKKVKKYKNERIKKKKKNPLSPSLFLKKNKNLLLSYSGNRDSGMWISMCRLLSVTLKINGRRIKDLVESNGTKKKKPFYFSFDLHPENLFDISHLVVYSKQIKPTIKILYCLVGGGYILDTSYLEKANKDEVWPKETDFEHKNFASLSKRLSNKKIFLHKKFLLFGIFHKNEISKRHLKSLILACGGLLCTSEEECDYKVVSSSNTCSMECMINEKECKNVTEAEKVKEKKDCNIKDCSLSDTNKNAANTEYCQEKEVDSYSAAAILQQNKFFRVVNVKYILDCICNWSLSVPKDGFFEGSAELKEKEEKDSNVLNAQKAGIKKLCNIKKKKAIKNYEEGRKELKIEVQETIREKLINVQNDRDEVFINESVTLNIGDNKVDEKNIVIERINENNVFCVPNKMERMNEKCDDGRINSSISYSDSARFIHDNHLVTELNKRNSLVVCEGNEKNNNNNINFQRNEVFVEDNKQSFLKKSRNEEKKEIAYKVEIKRLNGERHDERKDDTKSLLLKHNKTANNKECIKLKKEKMSFFDEVKELQNKSEEIKRRGKKQIKLSEESKFEKSQERKRKDFIQINCLQEETENKKKNQNDTTTIIATDGNFSENIHLSAKLEDFNVESTARRHEIPIIYASNHHMTDNNNEKYCFSEQLGIDKEKSNEISYHYDEIVSQKNKFHMLNNNNSLEKIIECGKKIKLDSKENSNFVTTNKKKELYYCGALEMEKCVEGRRCKKNGKLRPLVVEDSDEKSKKITVETAEDDKDKKCKINLQDDTATKQLNIRNVEEEVSELEIETKLSYLNETTSSETDRNVEKVEDKVIPEVREKQDSDKNKASAKLSDLNLKLIKKKSMQEEQEQISLKENEIIFKKNKEVALKESEEQFVEKNEDVKCDENLECSNKFFRKYFDTTQNKEGTKSENYLEFKVLRTHANGNEEKPVVRSKENISKVQKYHYRNEHEKAKGEEKVEGDEDQETTFINDEKKECVCEASSSNDDKGKKLEVETEKENDNEEVVVAKKLNEKVEDFYPFMEKNVADEKKSFVLFSTEEQKEDVMDFKDNDEDKFYYGEHGIINNTGLLKQGKNRAGFKKNQRERNQQTFGAFVKKRKTTKKHVSNGIKLASLNLLAEDSVASDDKFNNISPCCEENPISEVSSHLQQATSNLFFCLNDVKNICNTDNFCNNHTNIKSNNFNPSSSVSTSLFDAQVENLNFQNSKKFDKEDSFPNLFSQDY